MMTDHFVGVDVGSATTKAVIIDDQATVVGAHVVRSGASFVRAAADVLDEALHKAGLDQDKIARIFSTGYGRSNVPQVQGTRTEIACHARGAYHLFPRKITVVDIGGQDNKVIELDENGRRLNFKMNRKCAAGTGAFIEEIAHRLDIALEDINRLALESKTGLSLNSFCTVFAATEVLARIRDGVPIEDLARATLRAVARRIIESHPLRGEVVFTGGVVAHNSVVVDLLVEASAATPLLPEQPQLVGALGAALFAREAHKLPSGETKEHR